MNVAVASGLSAVTYWLAVSVLEWLPNLPHSFSQVVNMKTCISVSGRNSVSGITLIPRPYRARDLSDLVTMAEVGSTRLLEHTGVWSVNRGDRAKPNSLGRSLRLPLPGGAVSLTFCPKLLLTDRKCREIMVTIYATMNAMFTTIAYNAENSVNNHLA